MRCTPDIKMTLRQFQTDVEAELRNILDWWKVYMVDETNGGFYGSVNNENEPLIGAAKGVVLNSRILWAFSSAYRHTQNSSYLNIADRAYHYLINNFIDEDFGGVFWSVTAKGETLNGRKQMYGLAFCIYGFAEYYKVTRSEECLVYAKELYRCIEEYSFDDYYGGYIEAFARDWSPADDVRLSAKDDNEKKTMNTHLHILEAYANLYRVWNDEGLKSRIKSLLRSFDTYIINRVSGHLNLFMSESWEAKSSLVSFGHDIEAAWLLYECAAVTGNELLTEKFETIGVRLSQAALEGWDAELGGLWYEYEPQAGMWLKQKHFWPQAEAMVGYLHSFQITNDEKYLNLSMSAFEFIVTHLKDCANGEWFWGVDEDGSLMNKEKAGFWKCPYHSSRACIEVSNRVNKILMDGNC